MIETRTEKARKCGYRKGGGIYLVSDGELGDCGRLPIPLTSCPTCGGGFHAARGWTWVDGRAILGLATPECKCINGIGPLDIGVVKGAKHLCPLRPLAEKIGDKVGLLWIGESFYPTTEEYCIEAREQGISRRLAHLPQKFRLGLTYVFLAHRQAAGKDKAAIFGVFKPSRVEYVVKGDETEEQIAAIEKRGWTCVKVVREAEDEAL